MRWERWLLTTHLKLNHSSWDVYVVPSVPTIPHFIYDGRVLKVFLQIAALLELSLDEKNRDSSLGHSIIGRAGLDDSLITKVLAFSPRTSQNGQKESILQEA
jgi:hypothetical protein